MSKSDDVVLIMERRITGETDEAVIIGTNDAFRRASGYSNGQLVGRVVTELFRSGDHAKTLMDAIRGNGSLRSELACSKADSSTFMLGMHLMPAPARTPGRDAFVILGRDITAALQARQMQDSIQHLLAKVFSSVDAAVAIVNGAGRIVMTNPRMDHMLGYKPSGLVGRVSLDVVAQEARAQVAAIIRRQEADGCDAVHSAPVLRADGSALTVRITSVIATPGESKQFRIVTMRPEAGSPPEPRSESVGRIKLVGLEEVRAALGGRWTAAAERAMATAESVIKKHCGPQDSYSRADETSFLMCFGKLSDEESSFRAAMIGREIRNRLIGEGQDPDNAYVRSVAATVRLGEPDQPIESLHALLAEGLNKQLARIEDEARQTLRDALTCATCDLVRVIGRDAGQVVASQVLMPGQFERRLAAAVAALPHKESKEFDLDGLLLGLAAQHAIMTMVKGDTAPLMLTLSFDIFATRAATERFFAVCAKMDPRVTGRLILLLSTLPAGLPRTRLQDCVNRLRPYCRAVGYEVDELAELSQIDLSNSYNPVLVLSATTCTASSPDTLRALFISLQTRGAKVMVRGAASEKEAAAFRSVGADMVCMKRLPG